MAVSALQIGPGTAQQTASYYQWNAPQRQHQPRAVGYAPRVERAPAFELPENVSRRPAGLSAQHYLGAGGSAGKAYGKGKAGPKAKAKANAANPFSRTRVPVGGSSAKGKMSKFLRPVFPRGPERAAARRARIQMAKRMVARRVAQWRSRIVDGERQTVYVTLGGDVLSKGARAFRTAKADARYLKARGIASTGPKNSSIDHVEELEPYASRRLGCDPRDLAYWNLPESVEASYRDVGVKRLYDWQADCLSRPGIHEGRSLVYVAPTSAGKSLVSEVVVLRQLLFQGRRALIILPYVSICQERLASLRNLWGPCGVRIEALFAASDGYWHAGADVGICTIEKASTLLNRLLDEDALLRDIGIIVIDEMHLLGDAHRGYLLELILIKARLSSAAAAARGAGEGAGGALQIIGLSATMPNVALLSEWLDSHLYISDNRPVPLSISLATGTEGATAAARKRDPDGLAEVVREPFQQGHSVLVFCATKDWCERAAARLAEDLTAEALGVSVTRSGKSRHEARLRLLEELRQAPSGLCAVLEKTVPYGIAYHHAGLTVEERTILEAGFRDNVLGCLCATSTLAAGVNLPCRRVIIRSTKVGAEAMDAARFRQMAGRAGRAGLDAAGECIVMARSSKEAKEAQSLLQSEVAPLKSALHGQRLARAVLEAVSLGLVRTVADLEGGFARCLLRFHEEKAGCDSSNATSQDSLGSESTSSVPSLRDDLHAALSYLEAQQLLRIDAPGDAGDSIGEPSSHSTVVTPVEAQPTASTIVAAAMTTTTSSATTTAAAAAAAAAAAMAFMSDFEPPLENGRQEASMIANNNNNNNNNSHVAVHPTKPGLQSLQAPSPALASAPQPQADHQSSSSSSLSLKAASGMVSEASKGLQAAASTAMAAPPPVARLQRTSSKASLMATPLGDGVVHSALKPDEALSVFEDLQRAREGIHLDTDLHLIFLATPASAGLEPNWERFLAIVERLPARDRSVAEAVGVSHHFLMQQVLGGRGPPVRTPSGGAGGKGSAMPAVSPRRGNIGGQGTDSRATSKPLSAAEKLAERERVQAIHRRFYAALAIRDLVAEVPAVKVAKQYAVPRGSLQSLQSMGGMYCSMVRQLCERLRWPELAALFSALEPRLSLGASTQVLPLCKIPGVFAARARALLEADLETVEAVAKAPKDVVEAALRQLHQFESRQVDAETANRQEAVVRQAAQRIIRGAQEVLSAEMQQLEDEADEAQFAETRGEKRQRLS